jgi:class 3 adenylate cyclase
MAEIRGNTKMCSVLFVDIAGYSKKSNDEQMVLKERFVALWAEAIKGVPAADIMVVDAGDGAALTALVEPEDTIRVAQKLRELTEQDAKTHSEPMLVRMGINFGPVQLSKDVHGNDCIVGDAINSAQRVMSFAEPGQVMVSRAYYDVILPLSDKYKDLLFYLGKRADKHVRYYDVYGLGGGDQPPSVSVAMQAALHENDDLHPSHEETHARTGGAVEKPAAVSKSTAFVAEKSSNENPPASFPAKILHKLRSWLDSLFTIFKYSLVVLVIYELFVLVPVIRKPDQVKAELNGQLQAIKEAMAGVRAAGDVIEKQNAGSEHRSNK